MRGRDINKEIAKGGVFDPCTGRKDWQVSRTVPEVSGESPESPRDFLDRLFGCHD